MLWATAFSCVRIGGHQNQTRTDFLAESLRLQSRPGGTTGFSSEIGTKLRESAVGQAGGSCYSRAALSSNDSKTRYNWVGEGCRFLDFLEDVASLQ